MIQRFVTKLWSKESPGVSNEPANHGDSLRRGASRRIERVIPPTAIRRPRKVLHFPFSAGMQRTWSVERKFRAAALCYTSSPPVSAKFAEATLADQHRFYDSPAIFIISDNHRVRQSQSAAPTANRPLNPRASQSALRLRTTQTGLNAPCHQNRPSVWHRHPCRCILLPLSEPTLSIPARNAEQA